MTSRSSQTQPSQKRSNSRRRYFLDLPETGAEFFLQTAGLVTIALSAAWFQQRNDSPSPSLSFLAATGGSLVGFLLFLSLGFYLWERRLRRQLRERMAARHDRSANRADVA